MERLGEKCTSGPVNQGTRRPQRDLWTSDPSYKWEQETRGLVVQWTSGQVVQRTKVADYKRTSGPRDERNREPVDLTSGSVCLSGRKNQVFEHCWSRPTPRSYGVPQGSILGSFLFSSHLSVASLDVWFC